MDCRTAEGMVSRYIKHDLPLNELEEFLDHVQNCSSCYDELETYFIVHEVTHQLDDDSSDSVLDFKKLLEQDIRKSRRYIRKKKFHRAVAAVAVCALIAVLVVFLFFVIHITSADACDGTVFRRKLSADLQNFFFIHAIHFLIIGWEDTLKLLYQISGPAL